MNAIRQFIDVKNNSFQVTLPENFNAKRVEVIILPNQYENLELSQETKTMIDIRLNDYLKNTDDVQDFDELLDELECSL